MKPPAKHWDDVDWSQFAVGDQFTGLIAIPIGSSVADIISAQSPYHPDFDLVLREIINDNGADLDSLGVEFDEDAPEEPGLYEVIFEITHVEPEETIDWKVVRWKPTSARLSMSARPKTDGLTSHDRKKAAVAMGAASDEPSGTLVGDLSIKW